MDLRVGGDRLLEFVGISIVIGVVYVLYGMDRDIKSQCDGCIPTKDHQKGRD